MKRFIIDGNSPGRVMVIDSTKADALMENINNEGGCAYEITKAMAASYVFEGWDECGETVYWSISRCEWFDKILGYEQKEREEQRRLEREEMDMEAFTYCEVLPIDEIEEPPVRKNKRVKGGGWVPLVSRR